ncbi:hypothetical protein RhiXN_10162 [Rhizoctonia solani]|uniref:Uncharacterized protein n=1 Tax=Rhizoctonia solani TaxID=456999 RepID=A0A8H7LIS0_9AGAM|nr:uncharacterized protein RhiXN_10162 [Rhizoctonia solani]KAF8668553.1 hypothetical protein RHS04_08954 [Rhizoctonia solani]QRW23838.1 hypothetical protein RhiXN_10162 [Rhizoctonia solani]
MSHRRSTSDSTAPIFVAHGLQFAGQGEEQDQYNAAQRYDWDDVPTKLTEPRAPYDATQPFDYVAPKKLKVLASAENLVVAARRSTRIRKDENTPVASESELSRQLTKKRGRPRRSEASRKTDDGDNTEDESYMEPTHGAKRRSQHQPVKRPRVSRNEEASRREETDEEQEQETAPLRSGGARSRATPIKPQQANRWSNTEDRQLIDSLFEVIGSIPWRRVTAFMAEKGYSCADRGEGAIRGRWKVLRPRLYIVPPPVVRGAAAKSQAKAKERGVAEAEAESEHDDREEGSEHEERDEQDHDHDHEHGREGKERAEEEVERAGREAAEQAARDIEEELDAVVGMEVGGEKSPRKGSELDGEGDTTVEEEDPPAPRRTQRGTGPPKRPREPKPARQKAREREQVRETNEKPPTPPRVPTPQALHPPAKPPIPGAEARSPVPVSPNLNRRTLPSLQSPERTSERSLPLPIPTNNQRSPRLADAHPPHLPRPPTPPKTGAVLVPMMSGDTWSEINPTSALFAIDPFPERTHHTLPEHRQRDYLHPVPSVTHPHAPGLPSHVENPPRKSRKPEMHPFRTSVPNSWNQSQVQSGQGGFQGATSGQSGYQGQVTYQPPAAGQGGYQALPPGPGPAPGQGQSQSQSQSQSQGSFQQTPTGPYQPQGYTVSPGPQTHQSLPQMFQPTASPGRAYQNSPTQSAAQVYHSPSRQPYHSPPGQVYQPLQGQSYQSSPSQIYQSTPGQTYHSHSPSRQSYPTQSSPYQGPAAQVFPPPPLYVPPPTIFPIELQSPGRTVFQDGQVFSGGSPSRLPMLSERGGIGEGVREWDRVE